MSTILLRTFRRLVSLEVESVEELLEVEFLDRKTGAPDLELSVYEIDDATGAITQARTEHQASFAGPPREPLSAVSLSGFGDIDLREDVGTTRFSFTRGAHRSLQLLDKEELTRIVSAVIEERAMRQRNIAIENARAFVRERLDQGDAEWKALCEDKTRRAWGTWARQNVEQMKLPKTHPEGSELEHGHGPKTWMETPPSVGEGDAPAPNGQLPTPPASPTASTSEPAAPVEIERTRRADRHEDGQVRNASTRQAQPKSSAVPQAAPADLVAAEASAEPDQPTRDGGAAPPQRDPAKGRRKDQR